MEALSPRSTNLPARARRDMKKSAATAVKKVQNNDKIDEKWRPAPSISEPGNGHTYLTGKKLGKGGFAVCFEGIESRTERVYALKVVKSQVEQKKQLEKFRTELQIHAKMRHPNIVEFHRAFAFEEHTYVVLELCPYGSLMEMVKGRGCLSLPEVRRYMIQLCGGVKYLHRRSVLHRDLKIGNLFLDKNMDLKIGDFGLAAILLPGDKRRQTLCGTPNYIAPEILEKDRSKGHDQKVDTWAIGVICFALLTGSPPFASKTQAEIYEKLKQADYNWKSGDKNHYPQPARDLVERCLNLDADKRPEMDDLVDHGFFKIGAIADRLDPSARKEPPDWLLASKPRGDSVTPGYGIAYDKICARCGVGKLENSKSRPAVGGKANKSAIIEVEAENMRGLAPVVPLAPGVIYQHFEEAKESWATSRKYPPVASRKEATTSSGSIYAETTRNVKVTTKELSSIPSTANVVPRPSFAATQRQQALPTRGRRPQLPPLVSEAENKENFDKETDARKYMQERPVRAGGPRITRSNSSHQDALTSKPALLPKSNTVSEGFAAFTASTSTTLPRSKSYKTLRNHNAASAKAPSPVEEEEGPKKALTNSRSYRSLRGSRTETKTLKELAYLTEAANDRPTVKSRRYVSTQKPLQDVLLKIPCHDNEHDEPTRGKNMLPAIANQVKSVKNNLMTNMSRSSSSLSDLNSGSNGLSSPDSNSSHPSSSNTHDNHRDHSAKLCRPIHMPASSTTSTLISDSDPTTLLTAIATLHASLRPVSPTTSSAPAIYIPHPMVEKWVDYTSKYGLAYMFGDGSVGCLATPDGKMESHRSVVIRGHKENVLRRREEPGQLIKLPEECGVVDIYEEVSGAERKRGVVDGHGTMGAGGRILEKGALKMMWHPPAALHEQTFDRVRMVQVCDRLGRYMCKRSPAWAEDELKRPNISLPAEPDPRCNISPAKEDHPLRRKFVRFYTRLGNVGVWGFGPELSIQVNWPDHTKVIVHPDWEEISSTGQKIKRRALIEVFYYERKVNDTSSLILGGKEDELEVSESMTSTSIDLYGPRVNSMSAVERDFVEKVRLRDKVKWLRGLLSTWMVEGGVGRLGPADDEGKDGLPWTKHFWACEGGGEKLEWKEIGIGGE